MKNKLVVAIYTRVSTSEQALDGYSLDAQRRLLVEYCEARKYIIYRIYTDEGISAKDISHRPGMLSLLADAKEKKFNIILIWKLTRFTRNLADLAVTCDFLDKIGVSLVSYSEAFDSSTPAGRMVRSMLGTVAQFEREVISENISMALLERARQGKRTCGEILGYDLHGPDSFKINKTEAEYVNFVHDNYLKRKSIVEVTELAKKAGFLGKRGRVPTPSTIIVILTRPQYAGYNLFLGKLYKGNYESIRTVKQFNKVQRLILRQGKLIGQKRKTPIHIIPEE